MEMSAASLNPDNFVELERIVKQLCKTRNLGEQAMFKVLKKDQRVKVKIGDFGDGVISEKPEFSKAGYPCRYKVLLDDGREITFDRCDIREID